MSLEQAFVEAILADPDDDAPRLVYADWLEDNGDPDRADFIRVQCRSARMEEDDPERWTLRDRAAELLNQHEEAWRAGVPGGRDFERGFVAELDLLDTESFLDNVGGLAGAGPWHRLSLDGVNSNAIARLVERPELARLTSLGLNSGSFRPAVAEHLAGCRWLTRLRRLDLIHCDIADEGAAALAHSPHLQNLTHLGLGSCRLTRAGFAAVLQPERFHRLDSLDVGGTPLDSRAVGWLADIPQLARLRALNLTSIRVGVGLDRLLSSGRLAHLQSLSLADTGLLWGRVERLARTEGLSSLTELNVSYNGLRAAEVAAFGASPGLAKLRDLDLSNNPLGDDGARALAETGWRSLRRLDLGLCDITASGVRALADSPVLAGVRSLALWDNRNGGLGCFIGAEGARALAGSTALRRLEILDLPGNEILDAGAVALAQSPHLPSLRILNVADNGIVSRGALALAESPHLARLHQLDLRENPIDPEVEERLRARFGWRVRL